MVVLSFPGKDCRSWRKTGEVLYSENPRAIAAGRGSLRGGGGNVQNHDSVSRSPWEPNSMFWMEIHVPFLFFPISAMVSI